MGYTSNNGFFDLSAEERAYAYERACRKNGVQNFHDLSPEERSEAYEHATMRVEEGR